MHDLDRAETYFMRTLERDNRIAAAWYNLGVVYERKGLETEAMRAFDRYLRLQSGESDVDF
ncbi:MAG TPA: tetratricopeptide repeat protein [Turneriella sp.]|nr:tetratricopeptide repeat protein [Turneriella sp.]